MQSYICEGSPEADIREREEPRGDDPARLHPFAGEVLLYPKTGKC